MGYQSHATDQCGFLFMPWITDKYIKYTFRRLHRIYKKWVPVPWKSLSFKLWKFSVTNTQYDVPPLPILSKRSRVQLEWITYDHITGGATDSILILTKCSAVTSCALLKVNFFFLKFGSSYLIVTFYRMVRYPSVTKTTPATGSTLYSEGSFVRRFFSPKAFEVAMVRRTCGPKVLYYERSIVRKLLCSEDSLFRKALHYMDSMLRRFFSPKCI